MTSQKTIQLVVYGENELGRRFDAVISLLVEMGCDPAAVAALAAWRDQAIREASRIAFAEEVEEPFVPVIRHGLAPYFLLGLGGLTVRQVGESAWRSVSAEERSAIRATVGQMRTAHVARFASMNANRALGLYAPQLGQPSFRKAAEAYRQGFDCQPVGSLVDTYA